MTPDDLKSRAARARQILDDPLFVETFAKVEADAVEAMLATDATDTASLWALTASIKAVREVKHSIEAVMLTGRDTENREASAKRYA